MSDMVHLRHAVGLCTEQLLDSYTKLWYTLCAVGAETCLCSVEAGICSHEADHNMPDDQITS